MLVLLTIVTALAAGCAASKVAPAEAIHLSGTVADADGRPVAGARLLLFKEVDFGEALVGLTVAVATLGVACFFPRGPDVCARARKATSGSDGSFSYDLTGRDTQGSVGNADSFDLTTLLPATPGATPRAATTVRFRIQRATLAIPALRAWGAPITETITTSGLRINWGPLPANGYGPSPTYTVQFVDDDTKRVLASETGTPPSAVIDTRWLEDRRATAEVDASTRLAGPDTAFVFTYRSQTTPAQGNGAPPSRGVPCFVSTKDQAPARADPCRLTDGDLFSAGAASGDAVYLDLGRTRPVGLVVVRGGSSILAVEGSGDAKTWGPLGNTTAGDFSILKLAAARPFRYVRVHSTSGFLLGNLSEISVWP